MKSLDMIDDMNSLQVVMTYATDHKYRLRCLPWFFPKSYMNKYVFDGVHRPNYTANEIYVWHKKTLLDVGDDVSPRDQLYALFTIHGVDDAFGYLSSVAKSHADMYFLHKSLYQSTIDPYNIGHTVEKSIDETILSLSHNSKKTLDYIVSGLTFDLLKSLSVYMRPR